MGPWGIFSGRGGRARRAVRKAAKARSELFCCFFTGISANSPVEVRVDVRVVGCIDVEVRII